MCNYEKPDEDFPRDRGATNRRGRFRYCRPCNTIYCRRFAVKRRYGLDIEEYEALIEAGCSICGRNDGKMAMDHCHTSGRVRAMLCTQCNVALGMMEDSPERLRAAASYLERHSDK